MLLFQQKVYEYFSLSSERQLLSSISEKASTDLFFDRTFAYHFKYGHPPHHFLIEDIDANGKASLFALLTSIISMPTTLPKIKQEYQLQYKEKYHDIMASESDHSKKLFDEDMNCWPILDLPREFLAQYPSYVHVRWREFIPEAAWVRRLLHCAIAALAMNGKNEL